MEETEVSIALDAELEEADDEKFEEVINTYLCILDNQQNEIYNVRMMHHEVWRDVHQVTGISETRAGGRVEKVLITIQGKQMLRENDLHLKLFRNSFKECQDSAEHIVVPIIFKTNVVQHCNFEMKEIKEPTSPTSPAVSGEGALNPYDIVPCLKLREWPTFLRKKVLDMYNFKASNGERLPIFIVPTGNPLSNDREMEWRLSFAVLEIEIFKQLKSHQRRLYGLAKYLFKVAFEELDLIQSYHLKILFLRKLEEDDLSQTKPLSFLTDFFKFVLNAVEDQFIPHLFIDDCNIYPVHYYTDTKKEQFRLKLVNDVFQTTVRNKIKGIISHDTKVDANVWRCWLDRSKQNLEKLQKAGLSEVWVAGYLTRLLSVVTYCLRKSQNQGKLHSAIINLVKLVQANCNDQYVTRVVPYVICMLNDAYGSNALSGWETEVIRSGDRLSLILHKAFFCYEKANVHGTKHYLSQAQDASICEETLGVTVTKFHKGLDQPMDYVIYYCEEQLNSNRFYLYPNVIYLHMNIQMLVRDIESHSEQRVSKDTDENYTISQGNARVMSAVESGQETENRMRQLNVLVSELVKAADGASLREPYTGKLSYRHSSYLLLVGYRQQFSKSACKTLRELPLLFDYNSSLFERKELVTNFDLR